MKGDVSRIGHALKNTLQIAWEAYYNAHNSDLCAQSDKGSQIFQIYRFKNTSKTAQIYFRSDALNNSEGGSVISAKVSVSMKSYIRMLACELPSIAFFVG